MAKDFTFGASPEHLKRLLFAGLDEAESDRDIGSPVSVADSAEGPGARIGCYKLVRVLGEGGMGIVYLAEQEHPIRRQVALKIIKPGMDTKQVIARIEAERQALALLDHPNIAHVYDAGTTAGRPYFAMEYIKGVPITEHCDQQKLTIEQRLQLFLGVCEAIQHAHQKGIIHRDIKPSNILVHMEGEKAVPKVIDFGIAKAMSQALTERTLVTEQGHFVGTPEYMSPEQAQASGQDTDTRSDIYSLGVVLYELLAGVLPFDPKALREGGPDHARKVIREEQPKTPSRQLTALGKTAERIAANRQTEVHSLTRRLHKELEWIPLKAMRKDPARRYQSASELADDIRNYLGGHPLIAGPETAAYRVRKFVRRNRAVVGASAALGAVLVLGIVGSTWQAVRATRAEREQSRLREAAQTAQANEAQQRQRAEAGEQSAQRLFYAANMNLAQQAWEQPNVGRLRQLLEDTAAYPQRGFEWNYWQRRTHLELKTLHGHSTVINSVAFSPDGQRIVTGSDDPTAKVWEVATGKELLTLEGHRARVWSATFSPDGQRIVTCSSDQTAKVWEAVSGKELLTLKGHVSGVTSVAFSPDGQRIVTGSYDQTAKVWEAGTGKKLLTLKGHSDAIWSVAFSPDGQRIVTGSQDGTVKVWEVASGEELLPLKGHSNWVWSVAFSPDGRWIVTGSDDRTAKVWEAASGKEVFTLEGHSDSIRSVAFSSDGQRIVTGCSDQTAKVWEAVSGKELLTLKGHVSGVTSVAFSPDGQRIVTGSADQTAKVWEAASSKELLTLKGHGDRISSVAFSPDGQRIVTGSYDQTAKVWEAATGKKLHTLEGYGDRVSSVAFSPDGQRIVTGSYDQTAKVWEAATGKELLTLKGHGDRISSVAFSPDGQRIVTGSHDQTAVVWEAGTGKKLLTLKGHGDRVSSVAFSPDGQRIVTGSADQTAKVWEAASGNYLLTLKGHSAGISSVVFSADGQRIVTGSADQTAKVWDTASGKELLTLKGHSSGISSVAFSPDGQRIVTGSYDQAAKVWEAATTQQVAAWQGEEEAATKRLAVLRREQAAAAEQERALRAQDPGAIKQWLVLAPLPYEGRSGKAALEQEQIPQEAYLRVRAGERVKVGDGERVWRAVQLEDYLIDFNQLLGEETEWSVAYAVCYIQSEVDQTGLWVKVGSNDEATVYLNGKEIYRREELRPFVVDQDVVAGAELKARLNVLVFKVVNEWGPWLGSVRFTDATGQPVKGIKVTLSPP
jgi:WD40 repeat protein/serine/threonine protein kinase